MSFATNMMNRIMLALGRRPDVRVFRNNCGVAVFPDGSRVAYGLAPGSSDIIGWKRTRITPEMVGKDVAVFIAIEVKTGTGRPSKEQVNFIEAVKAYGGVAGVARTEEEAIQLITQHTTK